MCWTVHVYKGLMLFLIMIGAVGCGSSGIELAPVSGRVTLDGQPVADAGIVFSPMESTQGPPASGATDQNGNFTLRTNNREGATLGEHRVTISKADPFGEEVTVEQLDSVKKSRLYQSKAYQTKNFLPPQYADINTSELKATVEESENDFDFNLTSN